MASAGDRPEIQPIRGGILHTCSQPGLGGTQQVMLDLAQAAAARGVPVRCLVPAEPSPRHLLEWAHSAGISAFGAPELASANHLNARGPRYVAALAAEFRRHQPAVIHMHFGGRHMHFKDVLAARLAGVRSCLVSFQQPAPFPTGSSREQQRLRMASAFVDAIVVSTPLLRELVAGTGVSHRKIRLIRLGVAEPPEPIEREHARKWIGLPPDAFVVAVVSRLTPDKRVEDIIQAIERMPDPGGRLRLVIAGDGPHRDTLKREAESRLPGRCRMLGWVDDPHRVYPAADVLTLASDMEGFGLVFVEAALHGVPSVGSRVGGVPYAIQEGKTGLLVPARDPAALANALQSLREDDGRRRRMGEAARARARSQFSASQMAEAHFSLYEELAGTRLRHARQPVATQVPRR